MRIKTFLALCATFTMVAACGGDDDGAGDGYTGVTAGDGDGDMETTGDGDGDDPGDGDGDQTGDGDGDQTGDGDGDLIDIDPDNMIDNFEDGDGALIPNGGRQGYWYTFNDATVDAVQTPPVDMVLPEAGGAAGTMMAIHTTGSGFAEWGAGIGIDLNSSGGDMPIKMVYDSSAFTGIVLMAKGNGQIRAAVQIEATIPEAEGGTCVLDCDPHGKVLLLTDEWQQFTLPFDQLNQEGWGTPASWDATTVVGVQFKVGKDLEFDFWIDEMGFY
jgi:hypothetical protein